MKDQPTERNEPLCHMQVTGQSFSKNIDKALFADVHEKKQK